MTLLLKYLTNQEIFCQTGDIQPYVDLSLIVRPDKRQFQALDFVLEFKYISLPKLGLSAERLNEFGAEQLTGLPLVSEALREAEEQARDTIRSLAAQYPQAHLHGFAVVALGFERVIWQKV